MVGLCVFSTYRRTDWTVWVNSYFQGSFKVSLRNLYNTQQVYLLCLANMELFLSWGSFELAIQYGSLPEKLLTRWETAHPNAWSLLSSCLYAARNCKHLLERAHVFASGQCIWCERALVLVVVLSDFIWEACWTWWWLGLILDKQCVSLYKHSTILTFLTWVPRSEGGVLFWWTSCIQGLFPLIHDPSYCPYDSTCSTFKIWLSFGPSLVRFVRMVFLVWILESGTVSPICLSYVRIIADRTGKTSNCRTLKSCHFF